MMGTWGSPWTEDGTGSWDWLMTWVAGYRPASKEQTGDLGIEENAKKAWENGSLKKTHTHTQRKNNVIDKHCHFSAFKDKLTPVFMAVT